MGSTVVGLTDEHCAVPREEQSEPSLHSTMVKYPMEAEEQDGVSVLEELNLSSPVVEDEQGVHAAEELGLDVLAKDELCCPPVNGGQDVGLIVENGGSDVNTGQQHDSCCRLLDEEKFPESVPHVEKTIPKDVPPRRRNLIRDIARNPVFQMKAAAWIVWGVCYFGVHGPEQLSYMKVNHSLGLVLPLLNEVLNETMPVALGDCSIGNPPTPCAGDSPLYTARGGGMGTNFDILVRWVSGVNTVQIESLALHVIPDSSKPIQLEVRGTIMALKMSIRVKHCILNVCRTLWDNADGCCQPNRDFELIIATDCVDGADGYAQLGEFKIEWFDIDPITLSESFLGVVKSQIADLTPKVRSSVKKATARIFDGSTQFLGLTFAQVVSQLWSSNTAGGVQCSNLRQAIGS